MFGYVKAFKPYMRMFEYEAYRGVYCSVCKGLSEKYGFMTRLTLSYDSAFLGLWELSMTDTVIKTCKKRCPLHPVRKTVCLCTDKGLELTCAASVMLTYHKLHDDLSDKGFGRKLLAAVLLPFFSKARKKAGRLYPDMDKKLAKAMKEQGRIEKERTASIDKAAHPTGAMMSAVFSPLGRDREQREFLSRFGYLLGRYVYLCDALDDLESDVKSGSYNPLCVMFYNDNDNVTARKKAKKYCTDSVMLTLGELAEVYTKLQPVKHKDIIDNVIYLGLKNSFSEITGKERHNDK